MADDAPQASPPGIPDTADAASRLERLTNAGDGVAIAAFCERLHAAELAAALELIGDDARLAVLTVLPPATLGEALSYIEPHLRGELLHEEPVATVAEALSGAPDDIATDVARSLSEPAAGELLQALPPDQQHAVEALLEHEAGTAGGRMTGQLVRVPPELSAGEVADIVRAAGPDLSRPFYLYVTESDRTLVGVLNLRALITAAPSTPVRELAVTDVVAVAPDTDQEEAARLLKRYRLLALPVVDEAGHLLGTVTADDLLDVLEDEATEDMFRIVGVHGEEDLRGVWSSVRHRLPWLSVNLVTVLAAAWVVAQFEDTLSRVVVLAAFLPVVAGQGGNAGIQTLTIVVRSLALGRMVPGQVWRIVGHELLTGLIVGTVSGLAVAAVATAWRGDPWLGLVVGVALAGNMLIGVLAGVLIPVGLQRLRQDPALSGGIWLTTTTDLLGLLGYLALASLLITRFQ